MPPAKFSLPAHLRPASLIVYVRTVPGDDGDMPTVLGAFALVAARGIRQSRLEVEGSAASFAQGVLLVLVRALGAMRTPRPGWRIILPDRTVVDMVNGRSAAYTPATAQLVGVARQLLAERVPDAVVEHGRFHDLVRGLLPVGEDVWE